MITELQDERQRLDEAIEALERRIDEIEAQPGQEAPQLPASIIAKHLASMLR